MNNEIERVVKNMNSINKMFNTPKFNEPAKVRNEKKERFLLEYIDLCLIHDMEIAADEDTFIKENDDINVRNMFTYYKEMSWEEE